MSTSASSAMAEVITRIQPVLKAAGFRKRANNFNRMLEPGLVHVVSYQMGRPLPPGTVELPGLREDAPGIFAVQLGIYIEEVWQLQFGRRRLGRARSDKAWVHDYDCQLRRTVDNAAGGSTHLMWPLQDPAVGPDMVELLRVRVLPWLDTCDSREAILEALENAPVASRSVSGVGPTDS